VQLLGQRGVGLAHKIEEQRLRSVAARVRRRAAALGLETTSA
jgi:hypothetical protein